MAKWTTTHSDAMTVACVAWLLATALPASAQDARREPVSEVAMLGYLPDGATLEARLDRDFNGDGVMDVAYIGGTEDRRELRVLLGEADEIRRCNARARCRQMQPEVHARP